MPFRIKNSAPTGVTTTVGDRDIRINPRSIHPEIFSDDEMTPRLRFQERRHVLTVVRLEAAGNARPTSASDDAGAPEDVNNVSEEDN